MRAKISESPRELLVPEHSSYVALSNYAIQEAQMILAETEPRTSQSDYYVLRRGPHGAHTPLAAAINWNDYHSRDYTLFEPLQGILSESLSAFLSMELS